MTSGYRLYPTSNTFEGGVPTARLPLGVLGTNTLTATSTRQLAQMRRGWRGWRGSGQRSPKERKDSTPMRLHKDVKREDYFCSSWTMQPQKNDLQSHFYDPLEPCRARIVPTFGSSMVPTNSSRRSMISSN